MHLKIIILSSFIYLAVSFPASSQEKLNITDQKGMKQGHWIKRYQNNTVMYDGFFRDNHPVGEFKRYYETGTPRSVLIYSSDGRDASATIYHPNGNVASRGLYRNQKKEGKWQFFSPENDGYLIAEEFYSDNLRQGPSLKFYPDSSIAEKVNYVKGIKNGDWVQFYQNGNKWIHSNYQNGKLNGKFEVWSEEGVMQFSGQYKLDARDGTWLIYNKDGTVKYKINYRNGITDDRQVDIDESEYLDSLEKKGQKVTEQDNPGQIW